MKIAVMSPHTQKSGNTVVASLIASELSSRNRKVCLTHTTNKSNALYQYFQVEENDDKTCNPIQILNLIRDGGIRKNDISDYCQSVNDNLDIFSLNSEAITQDQLNDISTFICSSFPHDHIVFDFDDCDLSSTANKTILKQCDCVVYVLTQNSTELNEFNKNKKQYLLWMKSIPSIVVINRYCDIVGNIKSVASNIGIKNPKKWFKLGYNPWISYGTSNKKMQFLNKNIQKREYHVVDIDSDIKAIVSGILSVKHAQQITRYQKAENNKKLKASKIAKDVSVTTAN